MTDTSDMGPSGPAIYQALALKHALRLYITTGLQANRAYTPAGMARTIRVITSKPVRSTDLPGCLIAIEEWLAQAVRTNEYERASR
jgi:hypothetical protein